jgi:hypothetical protein
MQLAALKAKMKKESERLLAMGRKASADALARALALNKPIKKSPKALGKSYPSSSAIFFRISVAAFPA